jgi:hypothetical protein
MLIYALFHWHSSPWDIIYFLMYFIYDFASNGLSIFYEYQQFFQHCMSFSIQPPDYSDRDPDNVV